MKKLAIILILALLMGLTTVAGYRHDFNFTVTAEVMDVCPVTVEDTGDYRVRFYSEGVDQYASMTENERQTWELNSYINLDVDEMCMGTDLGRQLDEYKNITSYLVANLDQCAKLLPSMNDTTFFAKQYANLSGAYGRVVANYDECKNRSTEMKGEKDNATTSLEEKSTSLQNCITTRERYKTNLDTCEEDLEDSDKSGQNNIWWGVGGLAIGWFIWGRKKQKGTSEQDEFGTPGDEY